MLKITPTNFKEDNQFDSEKHRHHKPIKTGYKFCIAISDTKKIRGVAIVGIPVSRHLMDGWTLEVRRVCTDGVKNGCSMLYGACWRICKELGYRKLITYTLITESGASLKGAGWNLIGKRGGGTWDRKLRPRVDLHPLQRKLLWEQTSNQPDHT